MPEIIKTLESVIDYFVRTETEWPRTYIFQCCVYTVMENTADA